MGGPEANTDRLKQSISAVRASGGFPGNVVMIWHQQIQPIPVSIKILPWLQVQRKSSIAKQGVTWSFLISWPQKKFPSQDSIPKMFLVHLPWQNLLAWSWATGQAWISRPGKWISGNPQITDYAGIILCMRPSNERRRYNVTSSLIGWAHTQNDPWPWLW